MRRYLLGFISIVVLASCGEKTSSARKKADYDEAALRQWVAEISPKVEVHAKASLDSILRAAENDSSLFMQTISYLEKPLGDPNSPYRNEALYGTVLHAKLQSSFTDSSSKTQVREKLYLLMQNRVGSAANDFTYYTASGVKKTLYGSKAPYTLLYFHNPECDACKQVKAALISSPVIGKAVASDNLKVLAIYTDKDEKVWLNHLPEMPAEWLHGRDQDEYLYQNKVYDLKAIPTLYLLDENKIVLLKDVTNVAAIETALQPKQ